MGKPTSNKPFKKSGSSKAKPTDAGVTNNRLEDIAPLLRMLLEALPASTPGKGTDDDVADQLNRPMKYSARRSTPRVTPTQMIDAQRSPMMGDCSGTKRRDKGKQALVDEPVTIVLDGAPRKRLSYGYASPGNVTPIAFSPMIGSGKFSAADFPKSVRDAIEVMQPKGTCADEEYRMQLTLKYLHEKKDENGELFVITTTHRGADRIDLQNLHTGYYVTMNLMDAVMSLEHAAEDNKCDLVDKTKWFMPPSFVVDIWEMKMPDDDVMDKYFYGNKFLSTLSGCVQIFIPVHTQGRWFLIVVDFKKGEVYMLDPSLDKGQSADRLLIVKAIVDYLESLFNYAEFGRDRHSLNDVTMQQMPIVNPLRKCVANSQDTGVHVLMWVLSNKTPWLDYVVTKTTRDMLMSRIIYHKQNVGRKWLFTKAAAWTGKVTMANGNEVVDFE